MNTRELMMGNLLQIEGNPVEVIKIFEIHLEVHSDIFQFWDVEIEEVEPIPLTEEWLVRMGFTYTNSKFADYPRLLSIQISNTEYLQFEDDEFFIASLSGHQVVTLWNQPKYVHQIQNLYFALTKEELTTIDL